MNAAPLALNTCVSQRRPTIFIAAMHAQLARMDRTSRSQFAGVKMECVDTDHSCIKVGIQLQELSHRLRRDIAAARNGNVWMPRTQVRLQAGGERGFLHTFMDLEQVRVRLTDADPHNFYGTFCRKCSDTADG